MNRVNVTFSLPQELVEKAKAAGLLANEQFESWLRRELARLQHLNGFADTVEKLRSLEPPLTQEEIDAEIEAYRHETNEQRGEA